MNKKILVIEDEKNILFVFSRLLENKGYRVITAEDGLKGLELAQEELPDLILLDLVLPKLDGFKILSTLKDDENTKEIPVIIISARSDNDSIEETLKAGAENYLVKPVDRNKLLAEIDKYI